MPSPPPDAVATPGVPHETVTDPGDPRLADYRHMKDRDLSAEGGRFVAESELVVERLLRSGLPVLSVLATPLRLQSLGDALTGVTCPVFAASQAVLDAITGFHVHRGCLAIGQRPERVELPAAARTVVVLEDLVSADNIGATARNAAAFGADALVLSPRAADPYYRKAIRVSIGAVFQLPIIRLTSWPNGLETLKQRGFTLYGAVVDPQAAPLATVRRPTRVALLLGAEGPGLSAAARAACDHLVTIPMAPGADSLNVATAGAVALFQLQQAQRP